MTGSKGKASALTRLKKAGKAWVYENKTWKFGVVVVLCSPDEVAGVIKENVNAGHPASEQVDVTGLSGLTLGSDMSASKGTGRYLMWVDTSSGMKCVPALAHEAVHVAGMALSDRGVNCDIGTLSNSECVAYLVEDIVGFAMDKLYLMGIVRGKENEDEHA